MYADKKLIVFDLDGTLAPSKSCLDKEMSELLSQLLQKKLVAVISGGSYRQFENQFLSGLQCPEDCLSKLFLFPTCSTCFYKYGAGWKKVYEETLLAEEKEKIMDAFAKTFQELNYKHPEQVYGEVIEDRVTQMSFSALGQQAPLQLKEKWDPSGEKRFKIKKILEKHIPDFKISIGGTTSLDVTRKGIDKAYGINQIEKHLGIEKDEMLFIGDRIYEGGNDYPVKQTGVECISVSEPEETKRVIRSLMEG